MKPAVGAGDRQTGTPRTYGLVSSSTDLVLGDGWAADPHRV